MQRISLLILFLWLGSGHPVMGAEGAWPASFKGAAPRTGEARTAALRARGGTKASEAIAKAGLDWLAAHQDADGRLDADGFMKHDPEDDKTDGAGGGHHGERVACAYDGVTSALALMAWLADGSTPDHGPYAKQVKAGLAYCVGVCRGGQAGFDAVWNHTLCTQAVADAYRVTKDGRLKPVLEQAARALLAQQAKDGGWRYFRGVSGVPSTSFVAIALGQCIQAGIEIPKERVDRILAFLDQRVDAQSGRSEYHDKAERLGYTPTIRNAASALAARGMLGVLDKAPGLSKQLAAIRGRKPRWKISFKKLKGPDGKERMFQIGNLDPYAWYFTTMALAARGGGTYRGWFGSVKSALKKGQRKSGAARGSWDPLGNYSNSGGRVFVTAMCVLMLQSPYRFPQ